MPVKKGPAKSWRINYSVPPDLEDQLNQEMENKKYSDQNEMLTAILRSYFNEIEIESRIRAFLESEEGKGLIKKAIKDE